MREKNILDVTFEESRKLVDEAYVEEALKVSSNKQDRNRFWGEVVSVLIGVAGTLAFGINTHGKDVNSSFEMSIVWPQKMFNALILCNLIVTFAFAITCISLSIIMLLCQYLVQK